MKSLERQVGGDHYKGQAIEAIEYILANNLNFSEGSIVKYITRWRRKGGIADLEKLKHHADFLIEFELKQNKAQLELPMMPLSTRNPHDDMLIAALVEGFDVVR